MSRPNEDCDDTDKKPLPLTLLEHVRDWVGKERAFRDYSRLLFVLVTINNNREIEYHTGSNLWHDYQIEEQGSLWVALQRCLVTNLQRFDIGYPIVFSRQGKRITNLATSFLTRRNIPGVLAGCVSRTIRVSHVDNMDTHDIHMRTPFVAIRPDLHRNLAVKLLQHTLMVVNNQGGQEITTSHTGVMKLVSWEDAKIILYPN